MRYILIGVVLLSFIGCGSSSTTTNSNSDTGKPTSPTTKDSGKQPPSIPNI